MWLFVWIVVSIAPGGAFSLESAPFKLTDEMTAVMDGLSSPLFGDFVKAFTAGTHVRYYSAIQCYCVDVHHYLLCMMLAY